MKRNRLIEILIWIIIAILFGWRLFAVIYTNLINGYGIPFLYELYSDIIFCSLILIFPVIFKVIFGELPFEFIRNKNLERIKGKSEKPYNIKISGESNVIIQKSSDSNPENLTNSETYLISLARDSKILSEKVYSRSGLHLLIGCMIALIGILYFSIQSIDVLKTENTPLSNQLLLLLPRIGALFFIELIAFFFLKQYRITMDEFRYYENIKRQREADLAKYKIVNSTDNYDNAIKLIEMLSLNISISNLKKDESTELIELRKLDKTELELLTKIIDKISIGKK